MSNGKRLPDVVATSWLGNWGSENEKQADIEKGPYTRRKIQEGE